MTRTTPPVALFRWAGELPEQPTGFPERVSRDDGEQLTYEAAYPAALAIADGCRRAGYECSGPHEGELGWELEVSLRENNLRLFLNWTGISYPPANYVAVQWSVGRSWIDWLFRRGPSEALLRELQGTLTGILTSVPLVAGLQWLTDEEFDASYRRGEPLPEDSSRLAQDSP